MMDSNRRTENKRVENATQQMAVKMATRKIPDMFSRINFNPEPKYKFATEILPLESLVIIWIWKGNVQSKICILLNREGYAAETRRIDLLVLLILLDFVGL